MRTWEHSGFNVWVGEQVEASDSEGQLFLSRYLKMSPITLPNLEMVENPTKTVVRINGLTPDGEPQSRELKPLAFVAEVSQHIPDLFEQRAVIMERTAHARGELSGFLMISRVLCP